MNLSLQIGRGLLALSVCAAAGAYAFTQSADAIDADVDAATTAAAPHARLAIVTLHDNGETPHWVVTSVHVGDPVFLSQNPQQQVATHPRAENTHGPGCAITRMRQ